MKQSDFIYNHEAAQRLAMAVNILVIVMYYFQAIEPIDVD